MMRSRKSRELEADLDMTTFINLMVVLLAFLLSKNRPGQGPGAEAMH